jgi:hypothetical protein
MGSWNFRRFLPSHAVILSAALNYWHAFVCFLLNNLQEAMVFLESLQDRSKDALSFISTALN